MSTDDTRRNESIASTEHPNRRQFLGAAAVAAALPFDSPARPETQAAISDDLASYVATELVHPALQDLTMADDTRSDAIPKLERALAHLRREANSAPDQQRSDVETDTRIRGPR